MSSPAPASAIKEARTCTKCGSPLEGDSQPCRKCATTLADSTKPLDAARPTEAELQQIRGLLSWCTRNERPIRRWSLVVTNVAQVIALSVVGIWTMERFKQSEEPRLEPHMQTSVALDWVRVPKVADECEAELSVKLENIGSQAIDITGMHIKGWLSSTPRQKEDSRIVPEDELKQGEPFFNQPVATGYLVGHFPPGVRANDTLIFRFKNAPAKRAMWEVTFDTTKKMVYSPKGEYWDFVCNYKKE